MPAKILIRGKNNRDIGAMDHADLDDTTLEGVYMKGYIVSLFEGSDDTGAAVKPPEFGIIKITDELVNRADIEHLRDSWERRVDVELINPQAPPTAQRFRAFVTPESLSRKMGSTRGHATSAEIDLLMTGRNVTIQSQADNDVVFDTDIIDEADLQKKHDDIRQSGNKTVCRRMYRVSESFTDTVMTYNTANGNAPYEMTWAAFQLEVLDRRDEI